MTEAILLTSAIEKTKVDFSPSKTLLGEDMFEAQKTIGLSISCARKCDAVICRASSTGAAALRIMLMCSLYKVWCG